MMNFRELIDTYLGYGAAITLAVVLLMFSVTTGLSSSSPASDHYAFFLNNKTSDHASPHRLWFNVKLSRGEFLVASKSLLDPLFKESVVLIVKYDYGGAMGLIINKPTEVKLMTIFPEIKGLQKKIDTVFIGGPVARNRMFMLIRTDNLPEESFYVFHNIYLSSSMAVLKRMADDSKAEERFRVFDGYAGWLPGQLEREISRGDWHIIKADAETIFDKDPSVIWPELIRRSSSIQARLPSK